MKRRKLHKKIPTFHRLLKRLHRSMVEGVPMTKNKDVMDGFIIGWSVCIITILTAGLLAHLLCMV